MGLRTSHVVCFALMLTLSSSINALDITKILGQYPEFSTFSKYLTETKLAEQINSAKAITVLALDNDALASLAGKPIDAIKTVVGTHVIRDFYDEKRMVDAIGAHTELATFSQPIFVNLINEGEVAFASAAPGSAYDTKMVRAVNNQPDTVSVLQVTQPIVPVPVLPGASKSSPAVSTPAVATPAAEAPKSGVNEAPKTVVTEAPKSGVNEAPKTVVTEAPKSVDVEAPTSDVDEAAEAPTTTSVVDDTPAPTAAAPAPGPSSSSSRTQMGVFGAIVAFVSLFASL